ncbi:MAG: glycosyl hydrolase family 79 C-terminal domain-containing protein [Luteolibacter sp.]
MFSHSSAGTKSSVSLDASKPGNTIPSDFMGLSREWRHFPFVNDGKSDKVHPKYLQLIQNLSSFEGQYLSFRIGGATADKSRSVPDEGRWDQLNQVFEISKAPMIFNVNLAHGDPELTRNWIRKAKKEMPKEAIAGFEVGNEPDGWQGKHRAEDWTIDDYQEEFAEMRAEIVPSEVDKVIGPGWARGLPAEVVEEMAKRNPGAISMFTAHLYSFAPDNGKQPEKLLRDVGIQESIDKLAPGIAAAKEAGALCRIAECGSAWAGGVDGFSDTFAAAIWTLDFSLSFAEIGLDGVNFHSVGTNAYSAIKDDTDTRKYTTKSVIPIPSYYAMLLFMETAQRGARFIPVEGKIGENTKMWAVVDSKGARRLLILNKNLKESADISVAVGAGDKATLKRLESPSLTAETGIRLGGQTFDESKDGTPLGDAVVETLKASDGKVKMTLAPVSVALLTLE